MCLSLRKKKLVTLSLSHEELRSNCGDISLFSHSLSLVGSFTHTPWEDHIPLSLQHPTITLELSEGAQFKYVLRDEKTGSSLYFWSQNYPTVITSAKIQNNIYTEALK